MRSASVLTYGYFWRYFTLSTKPSLIIRSLQWRHNERDSVSNHQPHDCLLNRLFRRRSKKTSKLRVTGLCVGNSPVNSPHKGPVTRKMFPFDNVIMLWKMRKSLTQIWKRSFNFQMIHFNSLKQHFPQSRYTTLLVYLLMYECRSKEYDSYAFDCFM